MLTEFEFRIRLDARVHVSAYVQSCNWQKYVLSLSSTVLSMFSSKLCMTRDKIATILAVVSLKLPATTRDDGSKRKQYLPIAFARKMEKITGQQPKVPNLCSISLSFEAENDAETSDIDRRS